VHGATCVTSYCQLEGVARVEGLISPNYQRPGPPSFRDHPNQHLYLL